MTENKKATLLKQKDTLFRFLNYLVKIKGQLWENEMDYQNEIDSVLDQIIRINLQLNTLIND